MAIRKVLTIKLEFNLAEHKNHSPRLRAAHEAAVSAAIEAARAELLDGSIASVTTHMSFDYRWIESAGSQIDESFDWEDASVAELVETGLA